MTNRFTPNDHEDEVEDVLFDDEWYNKVSSAISYTFEILENNHKRIIANKEVLAKAIIDYNIEKRLTENASDIPIPDVLNWSDATSVQIFDEFSSIICLCIKKQNFKKHSVEITCGKNYLAVDQFKFWEKVNNEENNPLIVSSKIQENNTILWTIKKRS